MKILTSTIGRILLSIPFLISGIMHFLNADKMAGFVPSFLPGGGAFWVYLTGLVLIAGGISFIAGKYLRFSGFAIAGLLVVFIATIHIPNLSNPQMQQMAFSGLMKDLGLAGAALLLAGLEPSKKIVGAFA